MKSKLRHLNIIVFILIYILGVAAVILVASYMVSYSKKSNYDETSYKYISRYQNGDTEDFLVRNDMAAIIYDSDGTVKDQFIESQFELGLSPDDILYRANPSRLLAGSTTMTIAYFVKDITTLGTSYLIVGAPIKEEGASSVKGFLVRIIELRDLIEGMIAYVSVFTFVYAIVIAFVVINRYRERKTEQIRRQYTDNITHELKTPIASIKALTEALSDGMDKSPEERSTYYGMILYEANRQERMVLDALRLSKLQNNSVAINKVCISAQDCFRETLDKYASLCDLLDITFTGVEEVLSLPLLYTDPQLIKQVLEILLENAQKFIGEGSHIALSAKTQHNRAVLCVADDGVGISREDLPRIFERFYRAHRTDNISGSGLGLAIAQETLASLGEKIWAESSSGQGSRFYFTVKLN